jgi:hypothetical protein
VIFGPSTRRYLTAVTDPHAYWFRPCDAAGGRDMEGTHTGMAAVSLRRSFLTGFGAASHPQLSLDTEELVDELVGPLG